MPFDLEWRLPLFFEWRGGGGQLSQSVRSLACSLYRRGCKEEVKALYAMAWVVDAAALAATDRPTDRDELACSLRAFISRSANPRTDETSGRNDWTAAAQIYERCEINASSLFYGCCCRDSFQTERRSCEGGAQIAKIVFMGAADGTKTRSNRLENAADWFLAAAV